MVGCGPARRYYSLLRAAAVVVCGVRAQEGDQGRDDASVDRTRVAGGVAAGIPEAGHPQGHGVATSDGDEPFRLGGLAERGRGIVRDFVGGVVAEGYFRRSAEKGACDHKRCGGGFFEQPGSVARSLAGLHRGPDRTQAGGGIGGGGGTGRDAVVGNRQRLRGIR